MLSSETYYVMLCMFNNLGRFLKLHYAHSVWTWTYKQNLGKTIFSDHNLHAETGFRFSQVSFKDEKLTLHAKLCFFKILGIG